MRQTVKLFGRHRALAVVITAVTALVVIQVLWHRSSEGNQIRWANIVWKSLEANGDTFPHAFLMVDTQLQNLKSPAFMQLDLGNEPTVLYQFSDLNFGIKAQVLHLISGTIANRSFRNESFRILGTGDQAAPTAGPILIGSLGSSFFKERILLLDFVKQRIAILGKGSAMPRELEQGVEYLPITHNKYGNLLVSTTINGRPVTNVMFDTGSSMATMITGRANWIEWTKRQEHDSLNSVIRGNSWGRTAVLIGAPLLGTLCVGHACAYRPTVFFESSGLGNFSFGQGSQVGSALIGNVLFDGQFTVVVDIAQRRMGLFRGSLETLEKVADRKVGRSILPMSARSLPPVGPGSNLTRSRPLTDLPGRGLTPQDTAFWEVSPALSPRVE